ncbi:MAG: hypothetical protein ABIF71_02405 [Planctomycetota bacterium]
MWYRLKHRPRDPQARMLTAPAAVLGLLVGLIPTWAMSVIATGKLTGLFEAGPHDQLFTVWKDVTIGLTQAAGAVLGMLRERRPGWGALQKFSGPCVYAWAAFMAQLIIMMVIGFLRR